MRFVIQWEQPATRHGTTIVEAENSEDAQYAFRRAKIWGDENYTPRIISEESEDKWYTHSPRINSAEKVDDEE